MLLHFAATGVSSCCTSKRSLFRSGVKTLNQPLSSRYLKYRSKLVKCNSTFFFRKVHGLCTGRKRTRCIAVTAKHNVMIEAFCVDGSLAYS